MTKGYNQFLAESNSRNLHLEHLEDEVLNGGIDGARSAIEFLRALRDMLAGKVEANVNVTTKWDGSPSIFAGINPDNGRFFVGTKSIFNAEAKLNYTPEDIDTNHPGEGLNHKLKIALEYLPELEINGILQGDIMFTEEDLKSETIDGVPYITFTPNTITYAVPLNDPMSVTIQMAKIGVVWHTTYKGTKLNDMSATFDVDIGYLRHTRNVWYRDASFIDASGTATFTAEETEAINLLLSQAGHIFRTIPARVANTIAHNDNYRSEFKRWNNIKVREGKKISDTALHVAGLIKHFEMKLNKSILEAKKIPTRHKREQEKKMVMDFLLQNKQYLKYLYDLYNQLVEIKHVIIKKLESVRGIGTFVRDDSGFKVTSPEGFVAVDKLTGGAVKLVNRLTFSKVNFDTQRNWIK